MDYLQSKALREYAEALERENRAKLAEQDTLYRHIDSLEQELARMEQYYFLNNHLNQNLVFLK